MYRKEVVLMNENGLHARPASQLVQIASKYQSDIILIIEDLEVNPKSIIALLSASIKRNSRIVITAEGVDGEEAVGAIYDFIEDLKE